MIATRRTIVKSGMALPAAALLGSSLAFRGASAARGALALERFVYDTRFAEAFDIGQSAGSHGLALSPIADDLMSLWYDELDPLWKREPRALAGVTMAEALFALETLAMDRGMRIVYRGDHSAVEDGQIGHRLVGPAEFVARLAAVEPGGDWPVALAAGITQIPLGTSEPAELEFVTRAPGLAIRDVPLVSWVIAPRSAAALTSPG